MRKTIFANGCFDLVHRGHLELLRFCRELDSNSYVIVGLNSDASVRRLKGHGRPIIGEGDRRSLLEELRCVDEVRVFDTDDPRELIETLRPDIIVKGGDWKPEDVVGNDIAEVRIFKYIHGYSTTGIISGLSHR